MLMSHELKNFLEQPFAKWKTPSGYNILWEFTRYVPYYPTCKVAPSGIVTSIFMFPPTAAKYAAARWSETSWIRFDSNLLTPEAVTDNAIATTSCLTLCCFLMSPSVISFIVFYRELRALKKPRWWYLLGFCKTFYLQCPEANTCPWTPTVRCNQ